MIKLVYKILRGYLPKNFKSYISKLVFRLPWKPYVRKDEKFLTQKFPGGEKGGMIISADFEMSWAFRYSKKTKNYIALGRQEREQIPIILQLLNKYNIPVTWATVGHLFLKSCTKEDHMWMARIPHFDDHWRFLKGDWYDHDPHSNVEKDCEWYAPDLIQQILDSKVNHEIGCHTFSHIDCTYKNCPPIVLDNELQACSNAAREFGVTMSSFVFPGGTAGNFEVLKKHNYRIYRKNIDVDLAYPFYDEFGMLVTPTTSTIGDNGLGWSKEYFIYRFKKYIDVAIKTGTIAHFWFHPSIDRWSLENIMPEVLKYAAAKKEQGLLWIGTMGSIADHINNKN